MLIIWIIIGVLALLNMLVAFSEALRTGKGISKVLFWFILVKIAIFITRS